VQRLLRKILPWQIQWKGLLLESLVFLGLYIVWLVLRPAGSPGRLLIGGLSVFAPSITVILLVLRFLAQFSALTRRSWIWFGLGLACWAIGNISRTFFESISGIPSQLVIVASIINLLFYPLLVIAIIFLPYENHSTPSRFRLLLDAIISSGAAATLGWLILGHPLPITGLTRLSPAIFPIADLIFVLVLFNLLLANRKVRKLLTLWALCCLSFLVSDYLYSLLAPVNGFQVGGPESLGWTIGGLVVCVGIGFAISGSLEQPHADRSFYDLGKGIQNIVPATFVLVLSWFILVDWRISGRPQVVGIWIVLFLAIVLVVRLGMRAGEVELYNYWQIFNNIAEPTFVCNAEGKIILVNPALVRTLELEDEAQIMGKPLKTIFDNQSMPEQILHQGIQGDYAVEVLLRNQPIPHLLSLSPIFTEDRRTLIAGVAHDLREQKQQQRVIQEAYDSLQTATRQLE
jgi:PAS domain S-box-containing protein